MARTVRIFGFSVFALVALLGSAWAATAIWVQLAGPARGIGWALIAAALIAAGLARARSRRLGWAVLALAAAVTLGWYQTITPREDRLWATEVSRGVKAQVAGDIVTLSDIRDFNWITPDQATERWITRSYDLSKLASLDMITSVWANPDIAHLLVSFGFEGGEQVVFSVEIRKEQGEAFNEIGGFFRQFELVLIGATETDIVKLRTNLRQEDVSLYPVDLTPEQRREMFMAYVALAQRLEAGPEFYNTITANCTTVVWRLAHVLKNDLPIDRRLILSGNLPEYLQSLGALGGIGSMAERRAAAAISAKARALPPGADFSAGIRAP
ncbi:MAG: DUF4105 domain-containing protein [Sphingomonadales bacterium]|nr:DUF4105 domain-containing protein [Sphingomonadales bacterium]